VEEGDFLEDFLEGEKEEELEVVVEEGDYLEDYLVECLEEDKKEEQRVKLARVEEGDFLEDYLEGEGDGNTERLGEEGIDKIDGNVKFMILPYPKTT
jgi:hypothetical protein